ncbi:MAG: methyltransferase [Methanomassiliicoccales archaeon]|nr:methyltransferase [Methanomassiliicoccales archaeon]
MLRDRDIQMEVFPEIYLPAEDTLLMLSALKVCRGERVLEMGCGSGFLSLHMARAGASVTAADVDPQAVRNTEENARRNTLDIRVVQSDLFQNVEGLFDLIVFNPPYLRGEVQGREDLCWAGGESGLEVTSGFLRGAREHLAPGGQVLILVSSDADELQLEELTQGWSKDIVTSKTLFFEELKVLRLTL